MATEFKLPGLGENIDSGDLVQLNVSEGDEIQPDQVVAIVESDKASAEIRCPHGGRISKIRVSEGDEVKVGEVLLEIEEGGGGGGKPEAAQQQKPEQPQQKKQQESAQVKSQPPSRQATQTENAPLRHPAAMPPQAVPEPSNDHQPLPAGPAARRVARELGIDLRSIQGSGKRGRITPEDVEAAAHGGGQPAAKARSAAKPRVAAIPTTFEPPPGEPGSDNWGSVRRDRLSQIRKTIASHMSNSWNTIPHVTNFDDADVTDLEHIRKGVPPEQIGTKLTMMPFILRAIALALKQRPMMNAALDLENNQIIYKEYVNLGIAVDTPRGLVVPVIQNADHMNIPELARVLGNLASRARNAQFSVDELRGGTFTISNLGAIGGQYSTPIINHPEVAILLLGRSRKVPVVTDPDDRIEVRMMLPLSLSYDHRLIDGAEAARFLNLVKEYLQNPGALLLAE